MPFFALTNVIRDILQDSQLISLAASELLLEKKYCWAPVCKFLTPGIFDSDQHVKVIGVPWIEIAG